MSILIAALFTAFAIAYGIMSIRDANEDMKRLTELKGELESDLHTQTDGARD